MVNIAKYAMMVTLEQYHVHNVYAYHVLGKVSQIAAAAGASGGWSAAK